MKNRVPGMIYANDVADEIWANRHKPPHEKPWANERHPRTQAQILERRLNDGWSRIEEALRRGDDVAAWEAFWIDLLHQYEAAFDALPEIAE